MGSKVSLTIYRVVLPLISALKLSSTWTLYSLSLKICYLIKLFSIENFSIFLINGVSLINSSNYSMWFKHYIVLFNLSFNLYSINMDSELGKS